MSDSVTPWYKVANLFDMFFRPQSAFILVTMILGVLLLLSFVANYKTESATPIYGSAYPGATPSPLVQRSVKVQPPKAPAAPAPVLQAKAVAVAAPVPAPLLAPKVFKVEPKEQKKTHSELNTEHKPVLQTKMFLPAPVPTATIGVSAAPTPASMPASTKLDSTYEAYRNAMLSSGPRGQLEASKLQTKSGSAGWRERVPNLKLPDSDTASFLERTNVSVNDRMVAIFDAVKA